MEENLTTSTEETAVDTTGVGTTDTTAASSNNNNDTSVSASKRESTRSTIAKHYIYCFFAILVLVIAYCFYFEKEVSQVQDMITAVSAVLSGPLGFIIGYYFKTSENS